MSNLRLPPFRYYHAAYVTSDLECGKRKLTAMYGIEEFVGIPEVSIKIFGGGEARIAFAAGKANGVRLEVIQPLGGKDHVYRQALPKDPTDIALHHFASYIHSEDEWATMMDAVHHQGLEVVILGGEEYGTKYIYLDTRPQLGHMLEYVWLRDVKDIL